MMSIQTTLFPDNKGAFDPDQFVHNQLSEEFRELIISSLQKAYTNLQIICDSNKMTSRTKANILHDTVFEVIQENASSMPVGFNALFHSDMSGNKKMFFEKDGYIYILRKSGVVSNGTKTDKAIQNQELPQHVITIEYTVNQLWDSIASVSFKYIKGDGIELDYSIPLGITSPTIIPVATTSTTTNSDSTYSPKFKNNTHKIAQ